MLKEFENLRARMDALSPAEWRGDAALSSFVSKSLVAVNQQVYSHDFPAFRYQEYVPLNTDIDPGAEAGEWHSSQAVGEALVTDDYSADSPAIDEVLSANLNRFAPVRGHYDFSVQDMRRALMSGRPLQARKALLAREAIERKLDQLFALGHTGFGFTGLLNSSIVPRADAVDPGSGRDWASKTPDQRNADIMNAVATIMDDTNGIEGNMVDILLPPQQTFLLNERLSGVGMSGLEYLRASVPQVRSVRPWHYLKGAGDASSDRMVVYSNDQLKVEGLLPLPLYTHTAEQRGMVWKTELEARCGGTVFYKPKSARYVDKI